MLTINQVEKKLKQYQLKQTKYYLNSSQEYVSKAQDAITTEDKEWYLRMANDDLNKSKEKHSMALKYMTRLKLFKGCNGKLDFNPLTGLGHSYTWYEISKVIKGQLVLNTYGYSMTTSGHVNTLRSLFSQLGLKYLEVHAPRGLQDLDLCRDTMIENYAKTIVQNKYKRNKLSTKQLKDERNKIDQLKKLGIKFSEKQVKNAIEVAEIRRLTKLKWKRERKMNQLVSQVTKEINQCVTV